MQPSQLSGTARTLSGSSACDQYARRGVSSTASHLHARVKVLHGNLFTTDGGRLDYGWAGSALCGLTRETGHEVEERLRLDRLRHEGFEPGTERLLVFGIAKPRERYGDQSAA